MLIHCGLRQENFLMRPFSDKIFQQTEEREAKYPPPRKIDGQRVVHTTLLPVIRDDFAHAVLCDFGEARPGDTQELYFDDIQPFPYRAPEITFDTLFSYPTDPTDIWNVMLWHVCEGNSLFHPYTPNTVIESAFSHLREMVAVMGAFLNRSERLEFVRKYLFDENGQWICPIPVPDMSLESAETRLEGQDEAEFLRFMRRFLHWDPEMRATAADLCDDPWLKVS